MVPASSRVPGGPEPGSPGRGAEGGVCGGRAAVRVAYRDAVGVVSGRGRVVARVGAARARVVTALLTPAVRGAAIAGGMGRQVQADRWHRRPTPAIGGVAIYLGLGLALVQKLCAALGAEVAAVLGGPQDIEWAIAADSVHLLQTRPITALPEPLIPVPVEVLGRAGLSIAHPGTLLRRRDGVVSRPAGAAGGCLAGACQPTGSASGASGRTSSTG